MKLTKTQIKEKQEELVETILKLDALGKQKKSLVAILDDDFNENEAKYRNSARQTCHLCALDLPPLGARPATSARQTCHPKHLHLPRVRR